MGQERIRDLWGLGFRCFTRTKLGVVERGLGLGSEYVIDGVSWGLLWNRLDAGIMDRQIGGWGMMSSGALVMCRIVS